MKILLFSKTSMPSNKLLSVACYISTTFQNYLNYYLPNKTSVHGMNEINDILSDSATFGWFEKTNGMKVALLGILALFYTAKVH